MRRKSCWVCKQPFEQGFAVGVLVSTIGSGARRQKYQVAAEICQKCGNSPGGRRTRSGLWQGCKVAIETAIAHVANTRVLLTNRKNDESVVLTGKRECA